MKYIEVKISPFHKTLEFSVGGQNYDISNKVPEWVWNIGHRKFPLRPNFDWEIRMQARKVFIKYFKENIDKNLDENYVVF
jgi:hypothetical protein